MIEEPAVALLPGIATFVGACTLHRPCHVVFPAAMVTLTIAAACLRLSL